MRKGQAVRGAPNSDRNWHIPPSVALRHGHSMRRMPSCRRVPSARHWAISWDTSASCHATSTDGRYQIDNNFIENSVRPLAIGRKNYLFCGNHDAAEDAAIIYTFMGCFKLAQVDVRKWLNYFFTHIHDYNNDYSRDLMELLPHNLKQKGVL